MYQRLLKDVSYLDTLGFNNQDTSYLIAQEQFIGQIRIDTTDLCLPSSSLQTMLKVSQEYFESGDIYSGGYFTVSIPVFSRTQDVAIVSIAFNGYSLHSYYEELYLLRKFHNRWRIIRKRTIGVS